jgi:hypothetical protein
MFEEGEFEELLTEAKADFMEVCSKFPNEVGALRRAIIDGRINGSLYGGPCACLKGTLANAKWGVLPRVFAAGEKYDMERLEAFGIPCDSDLPAEKFFYLIMQGDTPETCEFSAIALGWCDEFIRSRDKVLKVIPAVIESANMREIKR